MESNGSIRYNKISNKDFSQAQNLPLQGKGANSKNSSMQKHNPLKTEDEYEAVVDAATGELAVDEKAKRPAKNKTAIKLVHRFGELALKEIKTSPVVDKKSYFLVLNAMKHLSEENIERLFRDWFSTGKPDHELIHITRALSHNNINNFKIEYGIK